MRLFGVDGEIVGVEWRSGVGTIGVIAVEYPSDGYWMAYIGPADGGSETGDIIKIATLGAKLSKQEASAFFPALDSSKYKYQ